MKNRPAITIIGTGAVGSALLDFFISEGFPVLSYWNSRRGFIYNKETGDFSAASVAFPTDETVLGEWIFVATPDSLIASTCGKLAEIPADWSRKSVIHCSGNMTSGVCRAVAEKGAVIASLHPLQTFKRGDKKERLNDIHISLEGDETLTSRLEQIVSKMGGNPVKLDSSQKQALHIAAVFVSNYLISLLCTAENLLKEEGIDNGLNILEPLIRQTLSNVFERGVDDALTGPVSRGDDVSVKEHLDVLAKNPDRYRLYQLLGKEALQIAAKQNRLTEDQAKKLKTLFG